MSRQGTLRTRQKQPRRLYWLAPLLISVSSFLLSGCFRRSPYGTAERYVENLQQFNYTRCYSLLSTQDRAERSLQQFLAEIPLAPDVSPIWFRPILHVMHFELGAQHRERDRNSATVAVRITLPDLPLWERTLDAKAGSDGSPSQLAERALATGVYPTVTYDDRIFLVKENHHWRILAGFAARDRVLNHHRQAMLDFYAGRFGQAAAQLRLVVAELQDLPGTGNAGLAARMRAELADISKIMAETSAATGYTSRLKLDKVAMRMAEERVPAIFGDVTNEGNRAIDELRLAVTWYEGRGKSLKIVDREEHPIVVTPIEFTDFSREVIPFLPGESRHFGFILSATPEIQQNATPYVTIASLAFTAIPAPLPRLQTASLPHVLDPVDPRSAAKPPAPATPSAQSVERSLATAHPEATNLRSGQH